MGGSSKQSSHNNAAGNTCIWESKKTVRDWGLNPYSVKMYM